MKNYVNQMFVWAIAYKFEINNQLINLSLFFSFSLFILTLSHSLYLYLYLSLLILCYLVVIFKMSKITPPPPPVVLHICSLHICVCLEFLMKIADFFISAMPPAKQQTINQAELKGGAHTHVNGLFLFVYNSF